MSKTGEILTKFPARNTKEQKAAFREWLAAQANQHGVSSSEIKNKKDTNVVLGNLQAPVLIAAHYDTACKSLVSVQSELGGTIFRKSRRLVREAMASIFQSSKPNPNNYNDNTSGVSALCRLLPLLKKESRVALAFLDGEEDGSCGAKLLAKKCPELGKELVINLDCVGFGDTFGVLYYKSVMRPFAEAFSFHLAKPPFGAFTKKIGWTFATDAQVFPRAVTVATFKRGKNVWFFPNIHTPKDVELKEENLVRLADVIEGWILNEFTF